VLPFAGYWLGREIYAFNQTMGITMMGGFMSWLWIIQAILIGILFLGSNYYLWLGMEPIPGSERYRKFVPPVLLILTIGFMVGAPPRSMVVTLDEAREGRHPPSLPRVLRGHVGQEHRGQSHDPDDLPVLRALPPRQPRVGEVVGGDGHGRAVGRLFRGRRHRG